MEGFGIDKLILILVIVLVLFGARRIPEIGSSIGKGIREFKRGMHDVDSEGSAPLPSRDAAAVPPAETPPATSAEPKRLLGR
jgi:sec-independent protein translocase protein TatA